MKKALKVITGLLAAAGGLLLFGTAGASDLGMITLGEIAGRVFVSFVMILPAVCVWEYSKEE